MFGYQAKEGSPEVLQQELTDIKLGLSHCVELNYQRVCVATDSLRAVNILNRNDKAPWYLQNLSMSKMELLAAFRVRVNHVFREANAAADMCVYVSQECS